MDLINREAVKESAKKHYFDNHNALRAVECCADSIPSAFVGMTNGEVIQAVFPNASIYKHGSTYSVNNEYNFNSTWWNLPYQKGGE